MFRELFFTQIMGTEIFGNRLGSLVVEIMKIDRMKNGYAAVFTQ